MHKRSPLMVILLTLVTLGIYGIYWQVKTKGEMVSLGAEIPTAWLLIIPFANIWWLWKYSQGVEKVTQGKLNGVLTFIGFYLVGMIMGAIAQDSFNNVSSGAAQGPVAPMPVSVESPTVVPAPEVKTDPTPPITPTPPMPPTPPVVQ